VSDIKTAARDGGPLITRSPLTGIWYVVSRWREYGEGNVEAIQKREVNPSSAAQLEALYGRPKP
jgi:hypothetical protein